VIYRADWGLDAYRVYRQLPHTARGEISRCVIDAQHDPYAASTPYGVDDGFMRTLACGYAVLSILVDADNKTFTVIQLGYAG